MPKAGPVADSEQVQVAAIAGSAGAASNEPSAQLAAMLRQRQTWRLKA